MAFSSTAKGNSAETWGCCQVAKPYEPPNWAKGMLTNIPKHGRLTLANLPTPLYRLYPSPFHGQMNWYIKRDDSTGGVELGGNKIRKLEFLLAEALALRCDSVITIGGEQSNHCRATAAAARMVGMEPHLILRTKRKSNDQKITNSLVGNILIDRMAGSHIHTCTPGEYGQYGSDNLISNLVKQLRSSLGLNPYAIPVGGSNGLGSWGYIEAVQELMQQWKALMQQQPDPRQLDHVVFACGSGGTAAGIAMGIYLAYRSHGLAPPTVHAMAVCDDADYFYHRIGQIAQEMGLQLPDDADSMDSFLRRHLVVHLAKGLGYAQSTPEELEFVKNFALATGIVLDPVYTGKALYRFTQFLQESNPDTFLGQNVLFWHTGGALGLFEEVGNLETLLSESSPCQKLQLPGKSE